MHVACMEQSAMRDSTPMPLPDFAEPAIGPAASRRTRWLHPGMLASDQFVLAWSLGALLLLGEVCFAVVSATACSNTPSIDWGRQM